VAACAVLEPVYTNNFGPLSYGQLDQWRDVENHPREQWQEANVWSRWSLPADLGTERVRRALRALAVRCPGLRTTYDLSDPAEPRQQIATDVTIDDLEIIATECGSDEEAIAVTAEVVNRPFDLRERPAWRALILTGRGGPAELFLARHHMVTDGMAIAALENELHTLLNEQGGLDNVTAAAGPLDLALWQLAPEQEPARAAAVEHWERAFASAAGRGFPGADPAGTGKLQYGLRSSAVLGRARDLAARTRTSVASVVLAAYTLAVARVIGVDRLVVESESSNRFNPRWRNVVTSMSQLVPILVTAADDLAEHATRVHRSAMTAYRRGMYDVDTVIAMRAAADYAPTCRYNFFSWPEIAAQPVDSPEPVWEEPNSWVRIGCALYAAERDGMLRFLLRARGVEQDRVAAVMKHMLALLNDSAAL
jgi:hypothetical protein